MEHVRQWTAQVYISEHDDGTTSAEVRLQTVDGHQLVGHGGARCNPNDPEVPEIGDELAVARALADLSDRLIHATVADLEGVTHTRVHLRS